MSPIPRSVRGARCHARAWEHVRGGCCYDHLAKLIVGLDDPSISSTYDPLPGRFNDTYTSITGSWSGAAGSWALDTFNIGGVDISQVQFGIAYNSTWIGLLPTCLSLPPTLQHNGLFKALGSNRTARL
jgi:hypothetical protein